jgi:hypothetical protein
MRTFFEVNIYIYIYIYFFNAYTLKYIYRYTTAREKINLYHSDRKCIMFVYLYRRHRNKRTDGRNLPVDFALENKHNVRPIETLWNYIIILGRVDTSYCCYYTCTYTVLFNCRHRCIISSGPRVRKCERWHGETIYRTERFNIDSTTCSYLITVIVIFAARKSLTNWFGNTYDTSVFDAGMNI